MSDKKTFYITTPIYYPSDKLHIGHSYTTVAADAMARYKRLKGYDVMFLTGTDEHGQKIMLKAQEIGVEPKEYVDKVVAWIKDLWKKFNISNDKFIRTTDEQHINSVQKIFKKLYDQGDIYLGKYSGMYCTPCESYWTKSQLIDGKCPDCGREVEEMEEESYFFRLSKYQDRLIKYIEDNPDFIQPSSRKNEMINNFLKPGLEDLSVSRCTFDWGVKVDFDPKHVVYVWIDALSNYITALGYGSEDESLYEKFWPAQVHLVGKEIIRFHTIIWPAILMALGLPLPKQVFGHGWLLLDGGKMSKSKGNVVDPIFLIDRYGVDSVRYFLLREVPFGSDGVFSNEALINRINADLANDLGNLLSRTVAMVDKYFSGKLPGDLLADGKNTADSESLKFDVDLKATMLGIAPKVDEYMDALQFSNALSEIWKGVSRTNKYIDETAPWVLAKSDDNKARLAQVMYNLLESLRIVSVLIQPYMPETTPKIFKQIGLSDERYYNWQTAYEWGLYPKDNAVEKDGIIFPRIDLTKELKELDELFGSTKTDESQVKNDKVADLKKEISIDDFDKLDLRVAKIVEAEKVEGSNKLIKIILDLDGETKQVVSGIAKQYNADELVGKKVVFVANLKPAKLKGILSEGMILAATEGDKLSLITVDKDIKQGNIVS